MKRTIITCAAMALLMACASAQGPKKPADWVAQLGADNLKDRDTASATLLGLGATARDAVHDALDSKDEEVKSRARELWKTLRWLVVPNADADTKKLVALAEKGSIDQAHWQDFVERHGAESLLLVAEFLDEEQKSGAKAQSGPVKGAGDSYFYSGNSPTGLFAVLDNVPPEDVARLIAETDDADQRARLMAVLDELQPVIPPKTALNWMQVQIALWNYQKAFDFGREYAFRNSSYEMVKACALAADRGGMTDKIRETAAKEIPAEKDSNQLCVKLSFYTGLFTDLGQKPLVEPLFDLVPVGATARASDESLRRLVETLLSAGMAERAVKTLHNVQSAEGLYMRSACDLQMQNEPTAAADWADAMGALDAVDDAKKKESFYDLSDLMHTWHDERAVVIWQKILSMTPLNTVYDANACFRMGEFLEQQRQYANAAEFYEKGMAIASKLSSGIMIATTSDGSSAGDGQQAVRDKIRELKSRAAEQKSIFNDSPRPVGGDDGSQ